MSIPNKKTLDSAIKKIKLNKNILGDCIFISDFGGLEEQRISNIKNSYSKDWGIICLLKNENNVLFKHQFPYYIQIPNLEKIINDMKIRQLLEYFKVEQLKPDNILSLLFFKDHQKDGLIIDYLANLRYNYNIINPSQFKKIKKEDLKNQLIQNNIIFSEWEFLYNYVQFKKEENIIEKIKRSMFQWYVRSHIDKPLFNKYYKLFGKSKETIFSSVENSINFLNYLFTTPFYTKQFSSIIDPIIINAIQWLNNIDNNEDFKKYADKRKKEIKPFKFNFKETFGKQMLINKEKIVDEIKKTRKLLKLPAISYDQ